MDAAAVPDDLAGVGADHVDGAAVLDRAVAHAPAAAHADVLVDLRQAVLHGDGAVRADRLAGAAARALVLVDLREDGGLAGHPVLLRPVADEAEVVDDHAVEVLRGLVALAVHEGLHALDALLEDADAAAVDGGAQAGHGSACHHVADAVVPGEDAADAADRPTLDGSGGLEQLGQGEDLPRTTDQAADRVRAAVEGAGLVVDPGAVERVVRGQAGSARILDRVGDESLVNALRGGLEQNRDVDRANACLGDGGSLHRVHGLRGAAVELVKLGTEGGVRAAGVSLDGVDADGFHVAANASPVLFALARHADGADEHDVVVMALLDDLRAFRAHPLVVGDVGEHLGADPHVLHFRAELLQGVEERARPVVRAVDLVDGLAGQPADALVDDAGGFPLGLAEVAGGHADGVLALITQELSSQVCHDIAPLVSNRFLRAVRPPLLPA